MSDYRVLLQLRQLTQEIQKLALDISALIAAVNNETTVEQGVTKVLQTVTTELQALIANSGNTIDPAALQAIVTQINTSSAALAAAAANVPTVPTTPPTTTTPPSTSTPPA